MVGFFHNNCEISGTHCDPSFTCISLFIVQHALHANRILILSYMYVWVYKVIA